MLALRTSTPMAKAMCELVYFGGWTMTDIEFDRYVLMAVCSLTRPARGGLQRRSDELVLMSPFGDSDVPIYEMLLNGRPIATTTEQVASCLNDLMKEEGSDVHK